MTDTLTNALFELVTKITKPEKDKNADLFFMLHYILTQETLFTIDTVFLSPMKACFAFFLEIHIYPRVSRYTRI